MKYLLIIPIILMFSCNTNTKIDLNKLFTDSVNNMKSPVTLVAVEKTRFLGSDMIGVTLKDSNGKLIAIGNLVTIANQIGASRKIGDTIR